MLYRNNNFVKCWVDSVEGVERSTLVHFEDGYLLHNAKLRYRTRVRSNPKNMLSKQNHFDKVIHVINRTAVVKFITLLYIVTFRKCLINLAMLRLSWKIYDH